MYRFTLMYRSPIGTRTRSYEAESYEEGKRKADEYCDHPCVQQIALSFDGEPSGDAAEDRRKYPAEIAHVQLGPDEVAASEDDEAGGDADGDDAAGAVAVNTADGVEVFTKVKDQVYLMLRDCYQVRVHKLGKHRLLVHSPSEIDVAVLRPPFKVSQLARVPTDAEEEHEQIQGHGVHGDHHQG